VLQSILRAKPASAKGNYIKGVTVASTMGPGVKIDLAEIRAMAA
jgi:large subunit ribosomal protein L1